MGREPIAEMGGLLGRDSGAGVFGRKGSGEIVGDSRDAKLGSKDGCWATSASPEELGQGTGGIVELEGAEGSGVMVLEV